MRCELLFLTATMLSGACVGPAHLLPAPGAEELLELPDAPPPPEPPDFVRESADDWVLLTSGEWLRGEVGVLSRETLEFDSEELGQLRLDWDSVAELHAKHLFTVLLENRAEVTGVLTLAGDVLRISPEDTSVGSSSFHRDDVQRFVRGAVNEWDHWKGKVDLGFTARRGNTDQTDTSVGISTRRRTAATRLELSYDALQSDQGGTEVANNQRLVGRHDVFLTSRLFVTPLGLELYRDRFQNIDLRATPYSGLGYTFVDGSQVEWAGTTGFGYRWTRFDSVAPEEEIEQGEAVFILATELTADLTEKIGLEARYAAQFSFEGLGRAQQNTAIELTYDVWGDLDFRLGFVWTRVGDPATDAAGNTPEPDDFRMDLGLGWSF